MEGEFSNRSLEKQQWELIWKLRVQGYIKLFLWQACKNLIPTKSILAKRQVKDKAECPLCGNEEETTIHVLLNCLAASNVWSDVSSSIHK